MLRKSTVHMQHGWGQGSSWLPPSHVPGTQSSPGRVRSGRHQQGSSSSGAAARDRTGSQRPSTIGPRGLVPGTLRHWGVRTGIQNSAQNCCPHRGPTHDPWGPALPCLSTLSSSSPPHPFISGVGLYDDHAWCLTLFKQRSKIDMGTESPQTHRPGGSGLRWGFSHAFAAPSETVQEERGRLSSAGPICTPDSSWRYCGSGSGGLSCGGLKGGIASQSCCWRLSRRGLLVSAQLLQPFLSALWGPSLKASLPRCPSSP